MLLNYYCYLLLPEASCYDMMVDGTSRYQMQVGIFLFPEQVDILALFSSDCYKMLVFDKIGSFSSHLLAFL